MSFLTMEIAVYHPQDGQDPERVLFRRVIEESEIGVPLTVEIQTGGSAVGDKRPLLFAIRKVDGSSSGLGQSMVTFTFTPAGSPASYEDAVPNRGMASYTKTLTIDVNTLIGSDSDWHGMYIGHEEPVEISRLHITWGGSSIAVPAD